MVRMRSMAVSSVLVWSFLSVTAVLGFVNMAPPVSADCTVNAGNCAGGDCTVNAGDCTDEGHCTVNGPASRCTRNAGCDVNLASTCSGGHCTLNVGSLCRGGRNGQFGQCSVNVLSSCFGGQSKCTVNVALATCEPGGAECTVNVAARCDGSCLVNAVNQCTGDAGPASTDR